MVKRREVGGMCGRVCETETPAGENRGSQSRWRARPWKSPARASPTFGELVAEERAKRRRRRRCWRGRVAAGGDAQSREGGVVRWCVDVASMHNGIHSRCPGVDEPAVAGVSRFPDRSICLVAESGKWVRNWAKNGFSTCTSTMCICCTDYKKTRMMHGAAVRAPAR